MISMSADWRKGIINSLYECKGPRALCSNYSPVNSLVVIVVDRTETGRTSAEGLDVLLSFRVAQGHIANVLRTLNFIQGILAVLNAVVLVNCVEQCI